MFIKFEGISRAFNTQCILDVDVEGRNLSMFCIGAVECVLECESNEHALRVFDAIVRGESHFLYGKFVDITSYFLDDEDIEVYRDGKKVQKKNRNEDEDKPF